MNNGRLPIELCERIIDLAGCEPWAGSGQVDYPALLACALVCHAWLPRARHNLFFRLVLRTTAHLKRFLDLALTTPLHVRELELSLPLRVTLPSAPSPSLSPSPGPGEEQASLASPLLAQAIDASALRVFALHYSEWLYPRAYIRLLGARFQSVTTLDLYQVKFATGGDLARVLWSFPDLRSLQCGAVIVRFNGGMARLPLVTPGLLPCRKLVNFRMNGCSSTGPFIIRAATFCSPHIESLALRSSFARWQPEQFQTLSAFTHLRRLKLVLASPTAFSPVPWPLPAKSSLIRIYAQATRLILATLASSSVPATDVYSPDTPHPGGSGGIRVIDVAYEPGQGSWRYLSGSGSGDGAHDTAADRDQGASTSTSTSADTGTREGADEEEPPYTYEQKRSVALGMLLDGLEDAVFLRRDDGPRPQTLEGRGLDPEPERPQLRPPFAGLRALRLRFWDTPLPTKSGKARPGKDGRDDVWWDAQVSQRLPALCAMGILSVEIIRGRRKGEGPLWDPEDESEARGAGVE